VDEEEREINYIRVYCNLTKYVTEIPLTFPHCQYLLLIIASIHRSIY
jgi:hypothetical protein